MGWAQLLTGQREQLLELTQGLRKAWESDQVDLSETPEIENELTVLEAEVPLAQGQMSRDMDMLEKFDSGAETLTPTTRAISQQLYGYMHRLNGNQRRSGKGIPTQGSRVFRADRADIGLALLPC